MKNCPKSTLYVATFLFSLFYIFSGNQRAHALTVPTRLEIEGDPGQILVHELEIYNEEDREITFYVTAQNFEARGETGSPYFLPETDVGLASWISSEETLVIGPRERVKFPYEIQIPMDAEAGGYFAAVFFGTTPPSIDEAGQVTLGSKTGTLIFLDISGDTPLGAGVIEFSTKNGDFFPYIPVTLYYRFSNDGGRKVMPLGTIEIKSMFGNDVAKLDANLSKGNVLPGSVRRFEATWDEINQDNVTNKNQEASENAAVLEEGQKVGFFDAVKMQRENFAIGKFTADLSLKYGENETAENQTTFWVVPWQLLSLVAGALILFIIILKIIMNRHNKKLIERVKKETLTAQQVTIAPTEAPVQPKATKEEATTQPESKEDKPEAINPVE
ncbi:hypothetical protein K0B04_01820 [Patescibacteria group bacterium]|nr:hypothetical protein [Patescibacteria group bacterium]